MDVGRGGVVSKTNEIQDLLFAIDVFCARPKDGRPGQVLGAEVVQLRLACDRLELEFSEAAGRFVATDEYEMQGSVSPINWISHNCKMSAYAAADRVCVGEQIGQLSESIEAMHQGDIGFAHLAVMARTAADIATSATSDGFDEAPLLAKAQMTSVAIFRRICQHARHAADPKGYVEGEVRGVEARSRQRRRAPARQPAGPPAGHHLA